MRYSQYVKYVIVNFSDDSIFILYVSEQQLHDLFRLEDCIHPDFVLEELIECIKRLNDEFVVLQLFHQNIAYLDGEIVFVHYLSAFLF